MLDYTSATSYVNYYRCSECGHVWSTPKDDPTRVTHVTKVPPDSHSATDSGTEDANVPLPAVRRAQ
jgi:uncharacterized Zn finger protein